MSGEKDEDVMEFQLTEWTAIEMYRELVKDK